MKSYAVSLLALLIVTSQPCWAWDSEAHTALVQLTRNINHLPGIRQSHRLFVTAPIAGEWCYKHRRQMESLQRIYLDLTCGADEPDHFRTALLAHSHQRHAPQRAINAFRAAVNTYAKRTQMGNAAYSESARHLGNSIHYLQDLTDFSKDMSSTYGRQIRRQAIHVAQGYLASWQRDGHYPTALKRRLEATSRELEVETLSVPEDMVRDALKERREIGQWLNRELANASVDERQAGLPEIVDTTMVMTIVLQESWVNMYLRYIGAQSHGQ